MNLLSIQLTPPVKYYHFIVPGEPVAKERARWGKGGRTYTPDKTSGAEKNIAWCFKAAFPRIQYPQGGLWGIRVALYSLTDKTDADNCLKLVCDSLQAKRCNPSPYVNDKQIREKYVVARTCDSQGPRTEILLYPLDQAAGAR